MNSSPETLLRSLSFDSPSQQWQSVLNHLQRTSATPLAIFVATQFLEIAQERENDIAESISESQMANSVAMVDLQAPLQRLQQSRVAILWGLWSESVEEQQRITKKRNHRLSFCAQLSVKYGVESEFVVRVLRRFRNWRDAASDTDVDAK